MTDWRLWNRMAALFGALAVMTVAAPVAAFCCGPACCAEEAADHAGYCCAVSGCDVQAPGFALLVPMVFSLEPAAGAVVLAPRATGDGARRALLPGDAVSAVSTCLTTTVLRI